MSAHVSTGVRGEGKVGGDTGAAGSKGQGIGIVKTITTVVETESREGSSEASRSRDGEV
jgi:hypothetical protein